MTYDKSKEIFYDSDEESFYGYIVEVKSNEKYCTVWGKSKGVVGLRQDLILGFLNKVKEPVLEVKKPETFSVGDIVEFTFILSITNKYYPFEQKEKSVNIMGTIRHLNNDKTIANVSYNVPHREGLIFADFKTSELTLVK